MDQPDAMPHSIWKGAIRFGLVNVPVALYPGEEREALDLTLLDKRDWSPVGYKKINKKTGEPVAREDMVRGFEYEKGRYVVLSDEELKNANPEATQTIEIVAFVQETEIDPRYFDRPYYLAPDGKDKKTYALLRETLARTKRAAIARVVIRTKEYLAALLARGPLLVLDLLRFADELRNPKDLDLPGTDVKVSERELKMAERLVEEMVEDWNPAQYKDQHRDDLLAYIEKKVKSGKVHEVETPAPSAEKKPRGEVTDMMSLLKRSVDQAGRGRRKSKTA